MGGLLRRNEQDVNEIKVRLVHESDTATGRSRYTEYMPGSVIGKLHFPRTDLIQAFGKIPRKLEITITEVEK